MTSVGETGGSGRVRRIHRGIIHQEDSLSSSRWFTTDEAGRMLHVTDALLSLGTLQVASRSVRTRKSRGPRFKREHALFLSLSLSNRGIWRTRRGGEQAKGVCKSQWKRISPTFFSRLCSSSKLFHVFLETVVSERDLEEVFLGKEENVD